MLPRAAAHQAQRERPASLKSLFTRKHPVSIACITAHPGDEVIAAGASLREWKDACFIHITEGSPRDLRHAFQAGFECRDEFVRARQHEFQAALHSVGLDTEHIRNLRYEDGEISNHLATVTLNLVAALQEIAPQIVITQPYEGTHPDHDSTAFAAQCACELLAHDGIAQPVRIEMAGLHPRGNEIVIGEFLTRAQTESVTIRLDTSRQNQKRAALNCLSTRSALLENATIHSESFRIAPDYDFTKPPHVDALDYEMHADGFTGKRWRRAAAEALRVLGLG